MENNTILTEHVHNLLDV